MAMSAAALIAMSVHTLPSSSSDPERLFLSPATPIPPNHHAYSPSSSSSPFSHQ